MKRAFLLSCIEPQKIKGDAKLYREALDYAEECERDASHKGEAVMHGGASITRLLCNHGDSFDYDLMLEQAACWLKASDVCVVYADRGVDPGMELILTLAHMLDIPIEYRLIESGYLAYCEAHKAVH